MFQSIIDFKTHYVLTVKLIPKSNEAPKLLWNIQDVLSSNKIQLLQKRQSHLFYKKTADFYAIFLRQKIWKVCTSV